MTTSSGAKACKRYSCRSVKVYRMRTAHFMERFISIDVSSPSLFAGSAAEPSARCSARNSSSRGRTAGRPAHRAISRRSADCRRGSSRSSSSLRCGAGVGFRG
jgi:hypothetical protein